MKNCYLKLIIVISFLLTYPFLNSLHAADTTKIKKPFLFSLNVGYTSNTVYGSSVDYVTSYGHKGDMTNKSGYIIGGNFEIGLNKYLFLRTGANFIHKQVNPMTNSGYIYQDVLNTDYIGIPIMAGINLMPDNKRINLSVALGTYSNIKIIDKSIADQERTDFKSSFLSEAVAGDVKISFPIANKTMFFVQYEYSQDITKAYSEVMYNKMDYKYKSHFISLGVSWRID